MAITFDASSVKSETTSTVTTTSFSHTTSGDDRVLIVSVFQNNSTSNPSSVTYGGENLTRLASVGYSAQNASVWYLLSPKTGSNTVSVSFGGSTYARVVASSFNGANDVKNGTTNSGYPISSISLNIPSSSDNICLMLAGTSSGNRTPSSGAGQTDIYNTGSVSFASIIASYKDSSSPSTSMSFSWGSGSELLAAGVEIVAGSQARNTGAFFQLF